MALVLINEGTLKDIGDSIRLQKQNDYLYKPSEMALAIRSIKHKALEALANRDKHNSLEDHTEIIDLTNNNIENIPTRFCVSPYYADSAINSMSTSQTYYLTDKLIAPDVTWLGSSSFYGYNIKELYLPKVVTINKYSFSSNKTLEKLILPKCTYIGEKAFSYNINLTLAYLPMIEEVYLSGFNGCKLLKTIIFGENLKYLGGSSGTQADESYGCFNRCTGLEKIYFKGTVPPQIHYTGSYYYSNLCAAFPVVSSRKVNVYVPLEAVDDYKTVFNSLSSCYTIIGMAVEDMPQYDNYGNEIGANEV